MFKTFIIQGSNDENNWEEIIVFHPDKVKEQFKYLRIIIDGKSKYMADFIYGLV